ncbi:MAG: AAA family ATPase [Treponema sp.]|uniref:AAA family ATPase n=1 Tax=Treponema sp. TaxID=166 RepID=UPI003FA2CB4B
MSKDLFETAAAQERLPLAARMRPRNLDEYIGQEHIVGKGRLLRRAIQADRLSSVIFFGPPGTGKTTLARVIANHTKSNFLSLNAVLAGVQQIRAAITAAEEHKKLYGKPTILFVDEVHRWNRAQQDALLPWVENGTVIFIGATTENPFFEVNKALVSRSRVFQLNALTDAELRLTVERCVQDQERGYGLWHITFTAGALDHLIETAAGDARSLLNALELAVETSVEHWPPPAGTDIVINMQTAEESIQQKAVLYDKDGDYHYDIISAFIKSIRGSDPDAALYWLARMVRAGESPNFIFRRMLISACEDIGLADPHALTVVNSAAAAFDRIGLPEGRYHLTHAALYLATCPKSNSALGFFDALKAVEQEQTEVPNHLKDANRDGDSLGHGAGYLYPHAYRDHWIAQQYLPDELIGRVFYTPGATGYEQTIRDEVLAKRETQLAALQEAADSAKTGYTAEDWQVRTEGSSAEILEHIRDTLIKLAQLDADDRVLIYRADGGLLLWASTRIAVNGCTAGLFERSEALDAALRYAETFEVLHRPITALMPPKVSARADENSAAVPPPAAALFPDIVFDAVLAYNPAATLPDFAHFFSRIAAEQIAGARVVFAFQLPQEGLRLASLLPPGADTQRFSAAESAFFTDAQNERLSWTPDMVAECAHNAGFTLQTVERKTYQERRLITQAELHRWFSEDSEYGRHIRTSFADAPAVLEAIIRRLEQCCRKPVECGRGVGYIYMHL